MINISSDAHNYLNNLLYDSPRIMKELVMRDNASFKYRDDFFTLKKLVDKILNGDSEDRYILMSGLRGVGKSTLLYQLYNYLHDEKNILSTRLLYLNLNRAKDIPEFNLQNVLDYFIQDINGANPVLDEPIFIFVDESQYVSDWSRCGKTIFDEQKKVFMIFTGSDALNIESNHDSARRALKMPIYPLNLNEYLKLKYECYVDNTKIFEDMLFTGEVKQAQALEHNIIYKNFPKIGLNKTKTFEYYLQYGGFPFCINRDNDKIIDLTISFKDRIIEKDLEIFKGFSNSSRLAAYKLINFLATQKPADVSLSKLANILNISKESVNSILSALEKTQLIFHVEPYGSTSKRIRKSWEYYFLAPQIKASIYLRYGQATGNINEYFSILVENMVASTLFKIKKQRGDMFSIFYDSRKGGVDFIINDVFGNIIPIEVGFGKKNKKQIKSAINNYSSDFGIIVSNKTQTIEREDDIVYIPLETFSFI